MRLAIAVITTALFAGLSSSAAPPVAASTAPVELPVAARATVVVQVNGWEKARGRLASLVEKALPNDAKAVKELIDKGLADLLDGRQLKGIDSDARILVAINTLSGFGDDSVPADLFVPVKDAAAFRDGFFKESEKNGLAKKANGVIVVPFQDRFLHLIEKGSYLILTVSEDRAIEYAGKYELLNTKSMGPDVAATFLGSDVALYVDLGRINEAFGEEIRSFRGLIDFAFQNAGGQVPGLDASQLDAAKGMVKTVFQLVEDGRAFVVGAEFRPEGMNVRLQGRFEKGSTTGTVLAVEEPGPHSDLAKLPAAMTEYHAGRFGPRVAEPLAQLIREFAAGEGQDDAAKAVETYAEAKKSAGPGATIAGSAAPDVTVTITEYKDPTAAVKARVALLKVLPAGASVNQVVLKEKPAVRESAQTFQNLTFHQVSLVFDFDETVKRIPEPAREATLTSLKKAVKDKVTYWIGAGDKRVIEVVAVDWEAAKKAIESRASGGIGETAAFKLTRSQLPADVSFLALQETGYVLHSLADQLSTFGRDIPGLPFEMPKINPVKGDPTFVGIAVVLKPEVGQFDLFIPAEAVGLIRKAFAEK